MIRLEPLGDRAFLARFPDEASAAHWARTVREARLPGVGDVVLAYDTAAVHLDPEATDPATAEDRLRAIPCDGASAPAAGRLVRLPVLYDGPDLASVAETLGLTTDQVVALHAGRDYRVFAIGFLPGFPYAGYLPDELAGLPRRAAPRARTPAGSVAIAGRQTGVYPGDSPGGWHLLGRTPLCIVDLEHGCFPISAGDTLRFEPISEAEFHSRAGQFP